MIDPEAVTRAELTRLFGISVTQVSNLTMKGVFPQVEGRNRYNLAVCVRNYVQHKLNDGRHPRTKSAADRDALVAEQHRKLKLANDFREGQLLLASDVNAAADALAQAFRLQVEGLPGRMAADLAGVSDPAAVKERLLDECRRVLADTARHLTRLVEKPPQPAELPDDDDGAEDGSPEDDSPAPEPAPPPKRPRGRPRKVPAS